MRQFIINLVVFISVIFFANAQLKVDLDLRPRFEYRHGFKTLFPDNTDPAAFVSQRNRIKIGAKYDGFEIFLSVQDILVWGDVPQLYRADNNGFALHQAWVNLKLSENTSLKLGRQEVLYDDQRILGGVDWAQQGRSHDLALLKYRKNKLKLDLGFAFNQNREALTGTILGTEGTYKAMQYAWLHRDWKSVGASFLFLNNGLQYIDGIDEQNSETRYSQTIGTHITTKGKLNLVARAYLQFGKDKSNNELSAHLFGLEGNYKLSKTKLTLGFELQSGNDRGVISDGKNNAFTPFYGTNHKFNGLMDYFYVGNHINNVGLLDIHAKVNFKVGVDANLLVAVHNFSAAADFEDKNFGNELDLVYSRKLQKNVLLKAGYSHLFESRGMELLKGNSDGNRNNWGWVMFIFKPNLLNIAPPVVENNKK